MLLYLEALRMNAVLLHEIRNIVQEFLHQRAQSLLLRPYQNVFHVFGRIRDHLGDHMYIRRIRRLRENTDAHILLSQCNRIDVIRHLADDVRFLSDTLKPLHNGFHT